MPAELIAGRPYAERVLDQARQQLEPARRQFELGCETPAQRVRTAGASKPSLALLFDASRPASAAYAARIADYATRVGLGFVPYMLPADATTAGVIAIVNALNKNAQIAGVLPLLPLPSGVANAELIASIDPAKDIDGLHPLNIGRVALGESGFVPCTAQAAMHLARAIAGPLRGVPVTVVGASIAVGRPLAQQLLADEATVTIAHIATRDLVAACRTAEVLFVAAGKAGLIRAQHVRPGAVVIDIGVNEIDAPDQGPGARRLVGDVDVESVAQVASAITRPIEGVGPLTTAYLMSNTVRAASAAAAGVAG